MAKIFGSNNHTKRCGGNTAARTVRDFHPIPFSSQRQSVVVANLCYCKYRDFFLNKKEMGEIFSTSPIKLLQHLAHPLGVLYKELVDLSVELFDVARHLARHLVLSTIL